MVFVVDEVFDWYFYVFEEYFVDFVVFVEYYDWMYCDVGCFYVD